METKYTNQIIECLKDAGFSLELITNVVRADGYLKGMIRVTQGFKFVYESPVWFVKRNKKTLFHYAIVRAVIDNPLLKEAVLKRFTPTHNNIKEIELPKKPNPEHIGIIDNTGIPTETELGKPIKAFQWEDTAILICKTQSGKLKAIETITPYRIPIKNNVTPDTATLKDIKELLYLNCLGVYPMYRMYAETFLCGLEKELETIPLELLVTLNLFK